MFDPDQGQSSRMAALEQIQIGQGIEFGVPWLGAELVNRLGPDEFCQKISRVARGLNRGPCDQRKTCCTPSGATGRHGHSIYVSANMCHDGVPSCPLNHAPPPSILSHYILTQRGTPVSEPTEVGLWVKGFPPSWANTRYWPVRVGATSALCACDGPIRLPR